MYNILPDTFLLIFDNIDFISSCQKLSPTEMNVFDILKVTFVKKSFMDCLTSHSCTPKKHFIFSQFGRTFLLLISSKLKLHDNQNKIKPVDISQVIYSLNAL